MAKRIAVMTTGGDACGMNSAIRSVVRTAISQGIDVYGVEEGLHGLLNNRLIPMDLSSVGGIINRGGTILKTVRSKDFHDKSIRSTAYLNLEAAKIDGIVSIGGDGSRKGMYTITKETGIPSVFVPASIDYDVSGTDWKLSVSDNGIGKAGAVARPRSGLGTGIVKALAKQLEAQVVTLAGPLGTTVSVTHATFGTSAETDGLFAAPTLTAVA